MDPLDMVHFHSVIRPGAATIARTPEMRALGRRSYLFAVSVHLSWVILILIAMLLKPDLSPPQAIEVSIVMDAAPPGAPAPVEQMQQAQSPPTTLAPKQMPAIGHSDIVAPGQASQVQALSKAAGNAGKQIKDNNATPAEDPKIEPWELSPKPPDPDPKPPKTDQAEKQTKPTDTPLEAPKAVAAASEDAGAASEGPPSDHVAAPRSGGEGAILVAPIPYYKPHPPYPKDALKSGQHGRVIVRIVVAASGKITGVAVVQSSGVPALDEAATRGVMTWRFNPGRQASGAVSTSTDVPIDFTLDN
jgi:protein TonB